MSTDNGNEIEGALSEGRQNVLALMKRDNKRCITELREKINKAREADSCMGEKCVTIPVLESQTSATQRGFENQEFIISRLLGNSDTVKARKMEKLERLLKSIIERQQEEERKRQEEELAKKEAEASAEAAKPKCFRIGPVEFKNFEIRDIIRFVFAIAVILILFHILGMKSEVQTLRERLQPEPSKTEEVSL